MIEGTKSLKTLKRRLVIATAIMLFCGITIIYGVIYILSHFIIKYW